MAPLLRRAANDDRAFERLYRRHARDVYRYSLAVLGEPSDAEDVTQTTFLNAYRAFQRGERPEKPENWLITIAHNVCRQRFRQQQRRPREVEYEDEIGPVLEPEEEGPSADDLRRAFQQLPPNQREALVMRELEGRPYKEIAEVLGISVSALETLLFRARRALREQLEEQITCSEAERAISKQLDGRLPAAEKRALRAHLRACAECSSLAQSQRAQRRALRTLFAVPLPSSLSTFSSLLPHGAEAAAAVGTTGAVGGGVALAAKVAAVVAVGTAVGGGAYEGSKHVPPLAGHRAAKTQAAATVEAAAPAVQRVAAVSAPVARATATTSGGHGRSVVHGPARSDERQDKAGRSDEQQAEHGRDESRAAHGRDESRAAERGPRVETEAKPERAAKAEQGAGRERAQRNGEKQKERAAKEHRDQKTLPAATTQARDGVRAKRKREETGRAKDSGSPRADGRKQRERDPSSSELEAPQPAG